MNRCASLSVGQSGTLPWIGTARHHPDTRMNPFPGLTSDRRTFLRHALTLAGVAAMSSSMFAQQQESGLVGFYPLHAIHTRLEGTAKVYVEISPEGFSTFSRTESSSGHEILDQAAEGMVALWVFKKGLPESKRKVIIPLEFKITKETLKELPAKDKQEHYKKRKPKPFYPYQAQERNLSGGSSVLATVSDDGFAEKALIEDSNPSPILNQCALLFTLLQSFGPDPGVDQSKPRRVKVPWRFELR